MSNIATFLDLGRYGELGNQMFQISTVSAYAWKNGKEPVFPTWKCGISGRDYTSIFKDPPAQRDPQELRRRGYANLQYMDLKYVELPAYQGDVNFIGYFQSEKYFQDYGERIKNLFQPHESVVNYIMEKYKHLLEIPNRVALQIRTMRRPGPDYPEIHASATTAFIEKSMKEFDEDSVFVVFADLMDEAKKMLPSGKKYIFIENEANYVDLFLMNYFDSYIVSPSTFGWWGAWLSKNPSPKVAILKDWYVKTGFKAYLNDNDVVPDRWKKIEI